ncbi:MAG: DUF1801 domain-containing protein [Patescibacteria group bacterium]|jgi:hypothetical protein|nr:DUF1801 domain-containing protein [Patescibacteria group bacterium]
MAELKTKKNDSSVIGFVNTVQDEAKKQDCLQLLEIFKESTGQEPAMWGTSIIGYGSYHYKSTRSKQEGDWPLTGFSPRKQNLTIYIMPGFDKYQKELEKLGKHKTSISCLYINKLDDVNIIILQSIIAKSYKEMLKKNPERQCI